MTDPKPPDPDILETAARVASELPYQSGVAFDTFGLMRDTIAAALQAERDRWCAKIDELEGQLESERYEAIEADEIASMMRDDD